LRHDAPRSAIGLADLWGRLAGSLLRPAPAFVYLVLLLLSFPLYRVLTTTATTPVVPPIGVQEKPSPTAPAPPNPGGISGPAAPSGSAPSLATGLQSLRVLRLTGDLSLRGGTAEPAPLRVHLGEAEVLVLKLFPDVADLPKDRNSALLVRVLDGETVVAATTRRVIDLESDQSLSFLLDRALLRSGTTYRVELTSGPQSAPAPPIHRQSFRLDQG
jgi:hypothetical protein